MYRLVISYILSFVFTCAFSQTVIKNVNVIDVNNSKIVPAQTVILKNGMIRKIRAADPLMKFGKRVTVIDGKGKYLMPGLVDAHVHFFQDGGLFARPDAIDLQKFQPFKKQIEETKGKMEDFLRRYLRNGITTVIDCGSTFNFLRLRDKYAHADFAPTVYITGPLITTYEPTEFMGLGHDEPFILVKNAEEAKAAVQKQLPYKPDFIKIWYISDWSGTHVEDSARKFLPIVKSIIQESHENKLKVAVHATERITAQLAVEAGCDYLVHSINDEVVTDAFIQLLKSKKVILCPTLQVANGYFEAFSQTLVPTDHERRESNPSSLNSLFELTKLDPVLASNYKRAMSQNTSFAFEDSIKCINLSKLNDAGVTIATGTDAGNIGTQHAASYLTELHWMNRCGMSNWQILQASTINAARILEKENQIGSIKKGTVADLILLNKNPVEDIANVNSIDTVIKHGKAWKPDDILKVESRR